jgi:ABC-type Co2+ transport system permease subunit
MDVFAPDMVWVFIAQVLQGATAGIITPAGGITKIPSGAHRHSASSDQTETDRADRFGHALTGAVMGVAGAYIAKGAIFLAAAALCIPALIALSFIRSVPHLGYVTLAAVAALATAILWMFLTETKPEKYED